MMTVTENLFTSYHNIPEKTAIVIQMAGEPDQVWTYRQLINNSNRYAAELSNRRISPGEVVILIFDHGVDLISAFFGAILHGSIPAIMPFLTPKLSPEHYQAGLASLIKITEPAAILCDDQHLADIEAALTGQRSIQIIINSQLNSALEAVVKPPAGLSRSPEDIVLLQHSSGTTGLQKGVALSHQAVANQLDTYRQALKLNDRDVVVSWLPLYHDMGLIAGFLLPVLSRIPLVIMSPFDWVRAPIRLLQAVDQYQGTLSWMPNFAYNFCAQKIRPQDLEGLNLSSWRAVINCSEPMYYESHQLFLERFQPIGFKPEALATSYAMAENVFAVTQGGITSPVTIDWIDREVLSSHHCARPASSSNGAIAMVSAGKPLANTEVKVLDDTHRELPEREIGEIAIQSNCMLTGYYRRPDLTEKAFSDGWYLTGDLGYIAAGEVYITGRKKDLIIVGGKNIYPQDIETLVNQVEGVHPGRVVAFGVANPTSGTEDVVVIAEIEPAEMKRKSEIANDIRQQVNRGSDIALRYTELVPRDWLLKTSSGKIARNANREKYLQEKETREN